MEAATKSLTTSVGFTGVWECLRGWWTRSSEKDLREAEAALLRRAVSSKVKVTEVPISDEHTVHTLSVSQGARTSGLAPVVLIHGYFMGSGSWAHSLDALASTGRHVYSIDWPGWGLSSKPDFPTGEGTRVCEQFFVEGIERWRRSVGLERVVLLGHSFGGYFAACYAMKHPENVEALILASPVGMGEKRGEQGLLNPERLQSLPWWQRTLIRTAHDMWSGGWTPMDIVRGLGPAGLWLARWYMDRRFRLPRELGTMEADKDETAAYIHQLAARPAGSERCLGELLSFGAWAKEPIGPRLAQRWKELGSRAPPVTLLYGESDWMDAGAGVELARELARIRHPAPEVIMVEGAGHQLFLDNPAAFNAACYRALGSGLPSVAGFYRQLFQMAKR